MDLLALVAKLTLNSDDYNKGISAASDKLSKFGSVVSGAVGGIAKVGAVTAKALVAGATAATGAAAALVKESVEEYAEYEQLAGGVQTLFNNTDSIEAMRQEMLATGMSIRQVNEEIDKMDTPTEKVMQNAANAYKTAGMSANDYMQTVISMAGALNKSTGDVERSADLADLAITDMADNVNKMGTSMEMVQNAYTGFSRGNYTMLDNLALGFAGTKEGMQELLDSAKKISGVDYNISSYADIVEAIHVVQTEMGITGTTAEEASHTISGSVGAIKAAWSNLIVGLSDNNADLDTLINNVVTSAETTFSNILPVAEKALGGIASFIEKMAPVIAERLPALADQILPSLINAVTSMLTALAGALPQMVTSILDLAPTLISVGGEIITKVGEGLLGALPSILAVASQIITMIAQGMTENASELIPVITDVIVQIGEFIAANLPMLVSASAQIILAIAMGTASALPQLVPAIVDVVLKIVDTLISNVDLLVDASIALILGLAEGLINALPVLLEQAPVIVEKLMQAIVSNAPKLMVAAAQLVITLVSGIISNLPKAINVGIRMVGSVVAGIIQAKDKIKEAATNIIAMFGDAIKGAIANAVQWGRDLIDGFVSGIKESIGKVVDAVGGVAKKVKDNIGFSVPKEGPLHDFATYAPDMMNLFVQGIKDNTDLVRDQLEKSFDFTDVIKTPRVVKMPDVSVTRKSDDASPVGNSIVMNIYPSAGMDEKALAKEISYRLSDQEARTKVIQRDTRTKATWRLANA